jgi:hypothetical protein
VEISKVDPRSFWRNGFAGSVGDRAIDLNLAASPCPSDAPDARLR